MSQRTTRTLTLLGIGLTFLALDAASKQMARLWLGEQVIAVIPWLLDLRLAFNRGISFGWLSEAPAWVGWATVLLAVVISLVAIRQIFRPKTGWLAGLGWTLLAVGAIGNMWERIWRGEVTDFLSLKIGDLHLFIFNIADFCLTSAVILLLTADWLSTRQT